MGCNSECFSDGADRVRHDTTHLFIRGRVPCRWRCVDRVLGEELALGFPYQMCSRLVDRVVGGLYLPVICNQGSPSNRGVGYSTGYI